MEIGKLDEIAQPCMIIPCNPINSEYFEQNFKKRSNVCFYDIPVEFLLRDTWGDMSYAKGFLQTIHTDPSVKRYICGPKNDHVTGKQYPVGTVHSREKISAERDMMYEELMRTLDRNELDDEVDVNIYMYVTSLKLYLCFLNTFY